MPSDGKRDPGDQNEQEHGERQTQRFSEFVQPRNLLREERERDETTEFGALSLLNGTHPAAQFFEDAIVPDSLSNHSGELRLQW